MFVCKEEVSEQGGVCQCLHDAVHETGISQVNEATQTWKDKIVALY